MSVVSAVGLGVAGNFIHDFIKTMFRRSVGLGAEESVERLERAGSLNPGDSAALVEAIEPAMREAHSSVGKGAHDIFIINGDHNVINLNSRTKSYVYSSIEDNSVYTKIFSIGSFNANSGHGRAFDFEEGRTIPFQLAGKVDRETIEFITDSISSYAFRRIGDNLESAIALLYKVTLAQDGRVKKLHVFKARRELVDL
jgi:hypothetical protein